MSWTRRKKLVHKTKNELAIEMLEWALAKGYPPCTVLADSWFGVAPFIKGLKRLKLSYVIEIKNSLKVRWILRKDLISCIVAHAVTHIGLALYVYYFGHWELW
jgi:SRSO17 transposase